MAQDGNDPSLAAPATEETIDELVKALSDPVYQRRTYAARRLAAIGMPAAQRLRAAVRKADAETALRAQRILAALDKRFLAGVEVRLQFSHSAIAWETPTNLSLTISNPTPYPSRIPFDIRAPQQSGDAEAPREAAMIDEDHARQVGDMLDLADLIQVRDAEGQLIDVAVDETGDDPAVDNAVRERSSGNGPEYTLQPGERITLTARNFNRGWARYPLLDAGVYTVVFDFVPDWDDPVLAAERIGRIVSNQATLTVTEAAPEAVSRKGAKAMIALRRDGSFLTVSLTNRSDLPAYVNTNFGATLPFAEGVWVYEEDGVRREVRVDQKPTSSWRDFEAERLRRVSPGDAVELARVDVADLQRALEEVGVNLQGKAASVHFRYMNLCDRHWQENRHRRYKAITTCRRF